MEEDPEDEDERQWLLEVLAELEAALGCASAADLLPHSVAPHRSFGVRQGHTCQCPTSANASDPAALPE